MKTTKMNLQKKDIVYEWFRTKTRLDTEIKSNSEMAFFSLYWISTSHTDFAWLTKY